MPKVKNASKTRLKRQRSFWKNPLIYVGLVLFIAIGIFTVFDTHAAGLGPAKDVYGCPIVPTTKLPVLRQGNTGPCVKTLQLNLNINWGYNLSIDGQFGPKTYAAVVDLQRRNLLVVDGIVGWQTWYYVLCFGPRQSGTCIYSPY